jgi:hypothetical protein
MTVLADRRLAASGTTRQPEPPPELPDVDDAKQFYLSGQGVHLWTLTSTTPWTASNDWWTSRNVRSHHAHYSHQPISQRLDRLGQILVQELGHLRALREGWDGRRAKPITSEALYGTILALAALLDEESIPPQFFPLPDGGIQFEWFADDHIEIEVDRAGEAHVLAIATNGDILAEGVFDPQPPSELAATVALLVKSLSARVVAERRGM